MNLRFVSRGAIVTVCSAMARANKIIFITGTDTGVGKTLLTALLLHHLRDAGVHALAMKPFCSGGRGDVKLLQSLQRGELADAEMNPFYFVEPIAPLVAAQKNRTNIGKKDVLARIRSVAVRCETLLVEGSGGLLVPLGKNYTVAHLIKELGCDVVVVARNRLGTINHTLLTINVLRSFQNAGSKSAVVLMEQGKRDISSLSNLQTLSKLLTPIRVFTIPFLGRKASRLSSVRSKYSAIKRTLATLLASVGR